MDDILKPDSFETSLKIPITYIHLNQAEDRPLIILFHGFADSAKSFLRRALPEIPTNVEVLAINGPFPIPQKIGLEWKHAFAWYFADFATKNIYIHPRVAAQAVQALLLELNLTSRKKILVGFSQGGFFLPHLLNHVHNVSRLLSIGAAYRIEDYPINFNIRLDALHGGQDEIIDLEQAQKSFIELGRLNKQGEFMSLPQLGHTFDNDARAWLKTKIQQSLENG